MSEVLLVGERGSAISQMRRMNEEEENNYEVRTNKNSKTKTRKTKHTVVVVTPL